VKISPKSTNFVYFGVSFWIAIQVILLTGQLITSLITTGIFSTDKVPTRSQHSSPSLASIPYFTPGNVCNFFESASFYSIKSMINDTNVLKWAQLIAVIACDKHPCWAPHQILQTGHISVRFLFSLYSIAVFCKI
jgi:hypothetical protein